MDYSKLAEEVLVLLSNLNHLPNCTCITAASNGELLALSILLNRGTLSPSDLSRAMCVSTARIAAMLRQLEKKKWIIRTPDPEDDRKISVALTPAGESLALKRISTAVERISALLQSLGPEDAAEYVRLQKKLVSAARG